MGHVGKKNRESPQWTVIDMASKEIVWDDLFCLFVLELGINSKSAGRHWNISHLRIEQDMVLALL